MIEPLDTSYSNPFMQMRVVTKIMTYKNNLYLGKINSFFMETIDKLLYGEKWNAVSKSRPFA